MNEPHTPDAREPVRNAVRVDGFDPVADAVRALLASSRRRLNIRARQIDPRLWESTALLDALREFATARAYREVRLLIEQPADLPRENGLLLALAQRLPTIMQLRTPDEEEAASTPGHANYLVNDDAGLLLMDGDGRLGGEFEAADSGRARHLEQRFDAEWERARPLSELRALGL